jgi:hypothetical protein
MNREETIHKLIEFNLEISHSSSEWAEGFIHDALRYGLKGFEQMTDAELAKELSESQYK